MTCDTIEDFLDRFSAAWRARDAAGFADLFIEDATYVTWQGLWLRGREEIARDCGDLFGRERAVPLHVRTLNVRALGPAVRLVVAAAGGQTQTFTLILRAGRWVCAALHNTAIGIRALDETRAGLIC